MYIFNKNINIYKIVRDRNRINYHRRKEAGTLKKPPSQKRNEYVYTTKNLKDVSNINDIEKLKHIKPKQKLVKIDMEDYEKFNELKNKIE